MKGQTLTRYLDTVFTDPPYYPPWPATWLSKKFEGLSTKCSRWLRGDRGVEQT